MKTYLELHEVKQLEEAASNSRDRLLIRILSHLGCRISEALGIAVDDIDFASATIMIQHLKVRMKLSCPSCSAKLGKSYVHCPGCGSEIREVIAKEIKHRRQRILPVDAQTLKMLNDHIQKGGPVERGGKKLIFAINRHRAWQIVKRCADKSGLPKLINPETGRLHNVSPHRLRDAFAVRAVKLDDSGDGLRLLQEHLGHTSFNTTAKYRKVSGDEHRGWYQKLWEE